MLNKVILLAFAIVSVVAGSFGNPSLGQSLYTENDIEEFRTIGEKEYYKKCTQGDVADLLKELYDSVGMDLKEVCKDKIAELKNLTETTAGINQQQDQSSTKPITYLTHYDYANGFSVEYPSDWNLGNVSGGDMTISKGTREFSLTILDEPMYALIDTDGFASTYFDTYKDMDGVVITDSLARINLGTNDEPALTFSYSKDYYENMVTLLIHNNVGYVFKYTTLKQNSDADSDINYHFLASAKFLN